jgi:hypothetical protein
VWWMELDFPLMKMKMKEVCGSKSVLKKIVYVWIQFCAEKRIVDLNLC